MRLINVETFRLEEFFGNNIPPYAILSHTWEDEEVTFRDITESPAASQSKAGFKKIRFTCEEAARNRIKYAWVDTCCI